MIFLDAERPAFSGYWPDLRRALRPGGHGEDRADG